MTKLAHIAAIALTLAATPAFARDGSWRTAPDQMHVVDQHIDVNTRDGRGVLLAKVEAAATRLCRDLYPNGTERSQCITRTVRDTAGKPGQATLALALTERGGVALASR